MSVLDIKIANLIYGCLKCSFVLVRTEFEILEMPVCLLRIKIQISKIAICLLIYVKMATEIN